MKRYDERGNKSADSRQDRQTMSAKPMHGRIISENVKVLAIFRHSPVVIRIFPFILGAPKISECLSICSVLRDESASEVGKNKLKEQPAERGVVK